MLPCGERAAIEFSARCSLVRWAVLLRSLIWSAARVCLVGSDACVHESGGDCQAEVMLVVEGASSIGDPRR